MQRCCRKFRDRGFSVKEIDFHGFPVFKLLNYCDNNQIINFASVNYDIFLLVVWAKNFRGTQVLVVNGHMLNRRTYFGKNVYWRCKQNASCKAKATSKDGRVIQFADEHNHPPRKLFIKDGICYKL